MKRLPEKQLLEIYDLVFERIHSDSFKISEIESLLFEDEYWFLQNPKDNWYQNILNYFDKNNLNTSILNINKSIVP